MRILAVVALLLATVAAHAATDPFGRDATNVLWIDQDNASCNDANSRAQAESPATPWCSWDVALAKATAGDTIYLRCGNAGNGNGSCAYRAAHRSSSAKGDMCSTFISDTVQGTSGSPITLAGYPGDDVIIDGRTKLRDLDDNGTNEQASWQQCSHASGQCSCGSGYSFATSDATNCARIWYLNLASPWSGHIDTAYMGWHRDRLQFWDGDTLIKGADCQWHLEADGRADCTGTNSGNPELGDLLTGGRWTIDPNIDRIFYHRADHTSPNTGTIQYAAHCLRPWESRGADWWTIRRLKFRAWTGGGIALRATDNVTTGWTFDAVDMRYTGDAGCTNYRCIGGTNIYKTCSSAADCPGSTCVAGRDGTGGYGIAILGTSAPIVVKNSTFHQGPSEVIHIYLGPTPRCGGASGKACGAQIINNDFYSDFDTGWDAECGGPAGAISTYSWSNVESGPCITDNSEGAIIDGNRFTGMTSGFGAAIHLEENDPGGTIIRNNIITITTDSGTGIYGDERAGAAVDGVQIYNNIIRGGRCQIELEGSLTNWTIANNTLRDGVSTVNCKSTGAGSALSLGCKTTSSGTKCPTGIVVRNNVIANHAGREINWSSASLTGAVLENNGLFDDDGGTVLQWGGTAYGCTAFDTETGVPTAGDANHCADPQFVTGSDMVGYTSALRTTGQTLGFTAWSQICGDANSDGIVTETDGVQALRAATGLPSTCPPRVCDVNADGAITDTDGVGILRVAAGMSSTCATPPATLTR